MGKGGATPQLIEEAWNCRVCTAKVCTQFDHLFVGWVHESWELLELSPKSVHLDAGGNWSNPGAAHLERERAGGKSAWHEWGIIYAAAPDNLTAPRQRRHHWCFVTHSFVCSFHELIENWPSSRHRTNSRILTGIYCRHPLPSFYFYFTHIFRFFLSLFVFASISDFYSFHLRFDAKSLQQLFLLSLLLLLLVAILWGKRQPCPKVSIKILALR